MRLTNSTISFIISCDVKASIQKLNCVVSVADVALNLLLI